MRKNVFDSCILPVITYGLQSMSDIQKYGKLQMHPTLQRPRQKRQKTAELDVAKCIAELKWNWVVAGQDSNNPEQQNEAGCRWYQLTKDRTTGRKPREAYVEKWSIEGCTKRRYQDLLFKIMLIKRE